MVGHEVAVGVPLGGHLSGRCAQLLVHVPLCVRVVERVRDLEGSLLARDDNGLVFIVPLEILNEPNVVDWVLEAVGANSRSAPASFTAAARILAANYYGKITGASNDQDREPLNTFLGSMRSLRDVDDPAWIRISSDRDAQTLSALGM